MKAVACFLLLAHLWAATCRTIAVKTPVFGLGPSPHGDFSPIFGNSKKLMIELPAVTTLAWGFSKKDEAVRNFPAINSFLSDLPKTSYAAWIDKEYSTSKQTLGRGRFVRELLIRPPFKATVTAKNIRDMLKQLISRKILPSSNNALTMVFFPPGVRVKQSSSSYSCRDFCTMNGSFGFKKKIQHYVAIPDLDCGSKPRIDCKMGLPLVDATTRFVSGEYFEAKTDGWFHRYYGGLASPCKFLTDRVKGPTGVTWTVNQIWSNRYKTCLTDPQRPRFDGQGSFLI